MFCLGLVSSYFYHGDLRRGRKGKKTYGWNGVWEQSAGSWGEALKPEAKGHLLSLVSAWWRRPRRFDYTCTLYNLQPISGERSPMICSSYLARVFDRNIWCFFFPTLTLQKTIEFSVWVEIWPKREGGITEAMDYRWDEVWPHTCGQTLTT